MKSYLFNGAEIIGFFRLQKKKKNQKEYNEIFHDQSLNEFDMPWKRERYLADWKKIARKIKVKSGWRCAICKASFAETQLTFPQLQIKKRNWLSVHHIDENPHNNEDQNLITLCTLCHLKVEHEARLQKEMKGRQTEMFPHYSYHSQMKKLKEKIES